MTITPTPTQTLTIALSLLLILNSNLSAARSESDSVHDLLSTYGLPRGLLPDAVKSYSISEDRNFSVELASTCYVHLGEILTYYERRITGTLSSGKISDLAGIQVKKLFGWVSITGIEVEPGLPGSLLEKVPACKSRPAVAAAAVAASAVAAAAAAASAAAAVAASFAAAVAAAVA